MFNILSEINWLMVVFAVLIYFILGALWFTPLFGKAYDKGTGVKRASKQKWPAIYYYAPFLSSLVTTVAITIVLYSLDVDSAYDALVVGALFGLSLGAVSFSNGITPNMPRQVLFGSVVGGYHLASSVIVALFIYTVAF